ncbi:MAG: hypothetical protein RMK57_02030 [Bryobacterales bacterium]|nr:hypothetical protein [Bryobacteraceae bacterium]MDW8353283.1 hypothetical protein [Bryobacterales bacterium]
MLRSLASVSVGFCVFTLTSCGTPQSRRQAPPSLPAPVFDQSFWRHWGDGKAELAAYDLVEPRYGQARPGVAVTIFVTEPFSHSLRVKADPGKHAPSDVFPVMKLNLVKDYATGIYDYNVMLSSFVALQHSGGRAAGSAVKISYSSQEWCGHVYSQLLFDPLGIHYEVHSYFDGEADQRRDLQYPQGGIAEDLLLLWARGMAAPVLAPGQSWTAPLLRSLQFSRDRHVAPPWVRATLGRAAAPHRIQVPAGEFEAEAFTARVTDGLSWRIDVERSWPHRILRWETSSGERAELLGAARLEYWKMNEKGFERALSQLGLKPRPPRTP